MRLCQGQNVEPQVLTLAHRDVGQSAAIPCRKRSGVEKLGASPAPSLPPVVSLRVPSPRSNRGVPVGVHVCAHHSTGKTLDLLYVI